MMLSDGEQPLVPRRTARVTSNYHQSLTSNMLPLLQCINFKYDTPTSNMILLPMNTPDVTEKIDPMAFGP